MDAQAKPFVLVDGSSYLYRAYHALPPLTNSKGAPTGAIYGLINMLKRLMADFCPEYMAVVFDAKGKTFRHDMYQDYKATRPAMPDELAQQIPSIHQLVLAMGLPLISIEGVEADDVIGTLVKHATEAGLKSIISTGDKDLAQLVSDNVMLINTMTNTKLGPSGVKAKFGVWPEQIVDYLALIGDTSDNVPGVPQVGPKTAAKWLQEHGNLENIIAHAQDITGKVGDHLRAAVPQFPLFKSIVTIKRDVDLPIDYDALKIRPPDKQTLAALFTELEFKQWLADLGPLSTEKEKGQRTHYETILAQEQLDAWLNLCADAELVAIDTETTGLNYMQARLVGMSIALAPGKAAYLPLGHDYEGAPRQLVKEEALARLRPVLENPAVKKVCQNIKYDMEILANEGIVLQGAVFDTMLESYVLESTSKHDLDSLALKHLDWKTITFEDVAGKGSNQLTFNHIAIEKAAQYAAEDADVTLRLHHALWPKVCRGPLLVHVFQDIEMPLVPVLARMERRGVLIDPAKLAKHRQEMEKRLCGLEQEAFLLAGHSFNLNSPKQLQEILFQKLKLPILQRTPKGQASTADPILQELALEFALPRIIIECRSLNKLISTYTHRLIEQINPTTGRVHTSYHQAGTGTGRLSSSEPNLQNIPIRTAEGRRIRQAFIAPKGHRIISADYSQIELRLMAHLSEDPGLVSAFTRHLDVHLSTAAEVWETPLDKVTQEMRRNAKAINFGLLYGMSAFGLARQLGIERQAAQKFIDRYFTQYPQVKAYMEKSRKKAKEQGHVETLWGRRLYVPDINAKQVPRQKAAERAAINAPLQGSAADLIKMAMIKVDKWLEEEQVPAKMIMQVHDELVFEAEAREAEQIAKAVQEHMSTIAKLRVPLLVSIGTGDNWDEASAH